ncbi:MAG: PilZ domain-containing protein [Xanthobacteraceae bacterium]
MAAEKRKHLRRILGQPVAILGADGNVICECTLHDVSDGGARLKLAIPKGGTAPEISPEFILSLSKRGNVFRHCQTVWRRSDEIGVRFIGRNT